MSYSQKVHEEMYEWNIYVNMLDFIKMLHFYNYQKAWLMYN